MSVEEFEKFLNDHPNIDRKYPENSVQDIEEAFMYGHKLGRASMQKECVEIVGTINTGAGGWRIDTVAAIERLKEE